MIFRNVTIAIFACLSAGTAQFLPSNAHVNPYYPQIADGGPPAQQWQTSLTFTNPTGVIAVVKLEFYSSNGGPLNLDFGQGASDQATVTIPVGGTRTIRTTVASQTVLTGWAFRDASGLSQSNYY